MKIKYFCFIGCPKLEKLSINWCENIQDHGIKFLIKHCKSIQKLSLRGLHKLTQNSFSDIIEHLPKLCYLDLFRGLKIQDSCLEKVVRKNKNGLIIINSYGKEIQDSNK